MAKIEARLYGEFDEVLDALDAAVLQGSATATLEDQSDFSSGDARCAVRVYERYSAFGSNRVSLQLTLFQVAGDDVLLSAITSGGSEAMFFKLNTFGEESFLATLEDAVRTYAIQRRPSSR